MKDWQPIETAPKDGTRVLLVRDNQQVVAFYDMGDWVIMPSREGNVGWLFTNPTHWMPLPALPEPRA